MFLHLVCCSSWRCHSTFCCYVVLFDFFSSVSTTVFLDSCGQIICPASCIMLGMFFFLSQVKMQTFPNLHTNLFKCSRHTFLKEGLRGFYSGTLPGVLSALLFFFKRFLKKHELHSLPALVAIAAENSLLFMAYGATQRLVSRMARVQEEELDVLGHGLAGGLKILLTYLLFNRQFS